jgi:hypothetical protein
MANPAWTASGEYFESCTCDYLCPCLSSNLAAQPTKGDCVLAFAFRVDRGRFGDVSLGGLCFALAGVAPGRMGDENWKVRLIVDERAGAVQEKAITAIASGEAGGPLALLAPLISSFLGTEKKAIRFEKDGLRRSVSIPGILDQAVEGVPSPIVPGEPLVIDNSIHPVNKRVALGRATKSVMSVFGLRMSETSGSDNGHIAPFSWQSDCRMKSISG